MAFDHTCLTTVLKNTSGKPLTCTFLPSNGRTLAVEEEVEVTGDIFDAIRRRWPNGHQRLIDAFLYALDNNYLEIVSTPSPVLQDNLTGQTKVLALHNHTFQAYDPCWFASISE